MFFGLVAQVIFFNYAILYNSLRAIYITLLEEQYLNIMMYLFLVNPTKIWTVYSLLNFSSSVLIFIFHNIYASFLCMMTVSYSFPRDCLLKIEKSLL